MMELNKFILLLISSSLLSSFTYAQNAAPSPFLLKSTPTTSSMSPQNSPASAPSSDPKSTQSSSSPSKTSAGAFPVSLPLLFPIVKPLPAANPVMKKVCDSTDHPFECLASISPFQTGQFDPISILKMEMQALRSGLKKAIAKATTINDDPSVPIEVKECLDTCIETYDGGLFDLDEAVDAIGTQDTAKLKTVLNAAVSDIETCQEAFTEVGIDDYPMMEFDQELMKIASNNLAIATGMFH